MSETLSSEQREDLCSSNQCQEHANGSEPCQVPLYKDELQSLLDEVESAQESVMSPEPLEATGKVVRSDE